MLSKLHLVLGFVMKKMKMEDCVCVCVCVCVCENLVEKIRALNWLFRILTSTFGGKLRSRQIDERCLNPELKCRRGEGGCKIVCFCTAAVLCWN